jgi:MoxR-like ATPase
MMNYRKKFNPKTTEVFSEKISTSTSLGDRCQKSAYVYDDNIILAVNIAIATGRPLLVRGQSGCGKSSLAHNVVKVLGWRYYEKVISSRTQARDLLYDVDMLRRLQDAQTKELKKDFSAYINPGVLWWAFDPESARKYGLSYPESSGTHLKNSESNGDTYQNYLFNWDKSSENDGAILKEFLNQNYFMDWAKNAKIEKIDDSKTIRVSYEKNYLSLSLNNERTKVNLRIDDGRTDEFIIKIENGELNIYDQKRAVVLLDEMDKADPDVPNNLLVPLGSLQFQVEEMNTEIRCKKPPLVIITTNDERELPPAFLRRCVELQLSKPDLLDVGIAHFGIERLDLLKKIVNLLEASADKKISPQSSSASPAEFKDTVQACIDLGINTECEIWDSLSKVTVWKHGRTSGGGS